MILLEAYVFSRNRAAQLDLLLRSIRDNFQNINKVHVLHEYDSDFLSGLEKIKLKHYGLEILFHEKTEKIFNSVFKHMMNNVKSEHIVGFCDDEVVIRNSSVDFLIENFDNNVAGIALRLGLGLKKDYHTNLPNKNPDFICPKNYLLWDWTKAPGKTGWCYPYSVAGNIFETNFFRRYISPFAFKCPNTLEAEMNRRRLRTGRKLRMSLHKTKVLNISVNKVQTCNANPSGKRIPQNIFDLNKSFMDGYVISTDNLYNYDNTCEFEEIKFNFIKE